MLGWLKAAFTPSKFIESTMSMVRGYGDGAKPRPFSYDASCRAFQSWVYAAAMLNAKAVASTPLRLYVRRRGGRPVFPMRSIPRSRKSYLLGDARHQPGRSVLTKVAEFGDDFEEVTDHPVLDVLRHANPWQSSWDQTLLRILYGELTGNAYLHPVVDQYQVPRELWVMPSQWVWVLLGKEGERSQLLSGYKMGRDPQTARYFAPDEVIHFKRPNPRDMWYGLGWVEAAWNVVQQNEALHDMDLAMYQSHARPDYLVVVQGNPNKDSLDRFEHSVLERLRGRGKDMGRFLTVTGQVDIKPLNWPPKDIIGREDIVEEIAAASGVPVTMLKANDPNLASARTGFAQWRESTILPLCRMDEDTLNLSLLPMFGLEDEAVLAYDNPVPADEAAETTRLVSLHGAGILNTRAVLEELGYAPEDAGSSVLAVGAGIGRTGSPDSAQPTMPTMPGAAQAAPEPQSAADQLLNGAQMQAATAIVAAVAAGEMPRDAGIGQLIVLFRLTPQQAEQMMGSAGTGTPTTPNPNPAAEASSGPTDRPSGNPDAVDMDRVADDGGDRDPDGGGGGKSARPPERGGERGVGGAGGPRKGDCGCGVPHGRLCGPVSHAEAISKAQVTPDDRFAAMDLQALFGLLDEQMAIVVEVVRRQGATVSEAAIRQALASPEMVARLAEVIEPLQASAIADGAALATGQVPGGLPSGIVFEATNPRVLQVAKERASRLAEAMSRSTADAVADIVAEGIRNGSGIDDIARAIQESTAFSRNRAELIARTESSYAFNAGQEMAWKESGVVEAKRWVLAPDPCEFCEAAAAAFGAGGRSVALGEPFFRLGTTLTGADGGVYRFDYADVHGPPLHPRCRCTLEAVLNQP